MSQTRNDALDDLQTAVSDLEWIFPAHAFLVDSWLRRSREAVGSKEPAHPEG